MVTKLLLIAYHLWVL